MAACHSSSSKTYFPLNGRCHSKASQVSVCGRGYQSNFLARVVGNNFESLAFFGTCEAGFATNRKIWTGGPCTVSPVPDRPDPAAAAEGLVTRLAADPVLRVAVVQPELAVVRRDTAAERVSYSQSKCSTIN